MATQAKDVILAVQNLKSLTSSPEETMDIILKYLEQSGTIGVLEEQFTAEGGNWKPQEVYCGLVKKKVKMSRILLDREFMEELREDIQDTWSNLAVGKKEMFDKMSDAEKRDALISMISFEVKAKIAEIRMGLENLRDSQEKSFKGEIMTIANLFPGGYSYDKQLDVLSKLSTGILSYVGLDLKEYRKSIVEKALGKSGEASRAKKRGLKSEIIMMIAAAIQMGNNPDKLKNEGRKGAADKEFAQDIYHLTTKFGLSMGKDKLLTLNNLSLAYQPLMQLMRKEAAAAGQLASQFEDKGVTLSPYYQAPAMGPQAVADGFKEEFLIWSHHFTKAMEEDRMKKMSNKERDEYTRMTDDQVDEEVVKWLAISTQGQSQDQYGTALMEQVRGMSGLDAKKTLLKAYVDAMYSEIVQEELER
jgi:hypothetical protein